MQDGRPFRKVPNPPTARELLNSADGYDLVILAARVEKVLARCAEIDRNGEEFPTILTASVYRILNGEK
jgi:hypothetical protein